MNTTKFKVIGISNGIAQLERVGGGFLALAEGAKYIGSVGDVVDVPEKDYVPEGNLSAYQALWDAYSGTEAV